MFTRRNFLKAAGVSLALPNLNANTKSTSAANPLRAVFIAMGYGVTHDKWYPKEEGKNYTMTEGLKPLAENREHFSIIQNLSVTTKCGPHDSSVHFLSNGSVQTCDQVIAETLCEKTRYNSLEISPSRKVGGGHGRISSIAKDKQGNFLPGVYGPLELYYKLFGSSSRSVQDLRKQLHNEKSLLDGLLIQMKSFNKNLGKDDKEILEQYYTSIRSLEKKLSRAEKWLEVPLPKTDKKPPKKDLSASETVKALYDLMVFAMQTDQTRVFSLMHPVQSLLDEMNLSIGGHTMSHYGQDPIKKPASIKRDQKTTELFNYFINRLKETKEKDGTSLLHSSMVVMGTPVKTGHTVKNGVTVLAGYGKGKIKQGQNIVYKADKTSLSNLWYSMIKQANPEYSSFSDSKSYMSEVFKG